MTEIVLELDLEETLAISFINASFLLTKFDYILGPPGIWNIQAHWWSLFPLILITISQTSNKKIIHQKYTSLILHCIKKTQARLVIISHRIFVLVLFASFDSFIRIRVEICHTSVILYFMPPLRTNFFY